MALCALDCAGSGNSGGEFVSLGHYERDDVAAVVDALRKRNLVGRVAVWGRSMGAATALLYRRPGGHRSFALYTSRGPQNPSKPGRRLAESGPSTRSPEAGEHASTLRYAATRDPDVAAVVADSPYASLVRLCRELVARSARSGQGSGETGRTLVAGAAAEAALALVRSSVRHRAGFDVYDVAPLDHVATLRHCATPALLLHGTRDDFIPADHARDLHAAHGGDAELLLLDVDHQAPRPARAIVRACLFASARPRRNLSVSLFRFHGISTSSPRRRRDPPPRKASTEEREQVRPAPVGRRRRRRARGLRAASGPPGRRRPAGGQGGPGRVGAEPRAPARARGPGCGARGGARVRRVVRVILFMFEARVASFSRRAARLSPNARPARADSFRAVRGLLSVLVGGDASPAKGGGLERGSLCVVSARICGNCARRRTPWVLARAHGRGADPSVQLRR